MSRRGPKFDLTEVRRLARDFLDGTNASDGNATIRFTAPRRSTEAVVRVLFCTQKLANEIIANGLSILEGSDFYRRKLQWHDVFDEYGLENYKGHNWYVKYCIVKEDTNATEYIEEVSFHPLEKEMSLPDGRTLKVTYDPSAQKG